MKADVLGKMPDMLNTIDYANLSMGFVALSFLDNSAVV